MSDITAQKSAERALQRARDAAEAAGRVLQLANDAAEIGTWAWDLPDGAFRWDERCRALVGLPPGEEGTYERFLAAVCPEDRAKLKEAVAQSATGKGDCNVEYRVPAPGGGVRWIASRGRVVRGQPDQMVGVAMDVTRRKEYEAALQRARAAEAASRAQSEFLALASHELHTPLNIALGFAGLLLEEVDGSLNAAQRRSLEKVDSSCRGLVAIAAAILDLSRLQLGDAPAAAAPFHLRESIRAGLEPFSGRARGKGLAFSWTVSPEVPDELSGDAAGLLQVLGLLVDNAVKFTAHGEIEVAVGRSPDLAGRVCLEVAVRDTGPGVPPGKQAAIFRPFEQAEAPDTRSCGGMGLGLAIGSALVAQWGGRIWLESEPGCGSVFRFTACLAPAAAGEPS